MGFINQQTYRINTVVELKKKNNNTYNDRIEKWNRNLKEYEKIQLE